jgi:hypothetical protein
MVSMDDYIFHHFWSKAFLKLGTTVLFLKSIALLFKRVTVADTISGLVHIGLALRFT